MKFYTETIELTTSHKREFVNITPRVKAALGKSGLTEGMILVSSMHVNAAVFVSDEEPGLLQDISDWAERLAPHRDAYLHAGRFESNAAAHLQTLLLNHQAVVPFSQGRLDLGPWQDVIFADFDGQRPRRIQVKVLGE
jgi:secondary thiamine-phosphate synthase enzyme